MRIATSTRALAAFAFVATMQPALAQTEARPADEKAWDAAVGLVLRESPDYSGAERSRLHLLPALYLRWGRISITNASGFVNRRNDEVVRGLAVEFVDSREWRLHLGLRYDPGRSESTSPALQGLGNVKSTVRARLAATWQPDVHWRVGAAWSVDAFGRGGGQVADVGFSREDRWGDATWSAGLNAAFGDARYMRTNFGVDALQSQRSGYPLYTPSAGVRDATAFVSVRERLGTRWVGLATLSANRLLGSTVDSPYVKKRDSVAASVGAVYEF